MPRTTYYVKGRKDGILRQVQHLPQNADFKQTHAVLRDPATGRDNVQPNYFIMMLGDPATGVERQVIRKDRIIEIINEAHGLPE